VSQVLPGGPAAKAGLAPGDLVRKLDGQRIESSKVLRERIAQVAPGTRVELVLLREGKERTIEVELARRSPVEDEEVPQDPEGGVH